MSTPLEHDLKTLHQHPAPEPAFAARLRRDLYARAERLETPTGARWEMPAPFGGFFRRTWGMAAIGVGLILLAILTFVGPQRVWAGIQRFFRYVPGVGFVDLENARVLPAPVAVEREGLTLIINQVIATQRETILRFEVQGLPPEDQVWPQGAEFDDHFRAIIRLADGTALDSQALEMGFGSGQIHFPPLPPEVSHITLEFNQLPLTPPGMYPENWLLTLLLQPIDGTPAADLFPQPYTPENAADTHHGITVQVKQVAHTPEGTAIQLQIFGNSSPWGPSAHSFDLWDDIGHSYGENYEASASSVKSVVVSVEEAQEVIPSDAHEQTLVFYPVSLSARQLTLEIPAFEVFTTAEGSFTIDLGDNPQVGDSWELDIPVEVDGLEATITSARITERTEDYGDHKEHTIRLEFVIRAELAENGSGITMLMVSSPEAEFSGSGGESNRPGEGSFVASLYNDAAQPFPHGPLTVQLEQAHLYYPGPWVVTWAVPNGETAPNPQTGPVIQHPAARETQNGLTLHLAETVQTDRLLALAIEADHLPAGTEFLGLASWGTNPFNQPRMTLSDNLGNAEFPNYWNMRWAAYQEKNISQTHLNFAPPHPLASQLTLNIPAVHLFVSSQTSFDVTLPPNKTPILEELANWPEIPPDGAWEVDIPIEIAGFPIHFTHAWLEDDSGAQSLVLFAEDVAGQVGNFYLTGLQMEMVQMPNGQTWNVPPYPLSSGSAGQIPGTSTSYAMLRIEAFDPEQPTLLSGTYHVQLNGVVVTVPGPWQLSWDLLGP